MYSQIHSRNFTDDEGDRYYEPTLIIPGKNLIVEYSELPQTWEYFGRIFKINDFTGLGKVITDESVLRPNYANFCNFAESGNYRIAIRLVKYIKAGSLKIYQIN